MNNNRDWLRSPPSVALMAAALLASLVLGTAFLVINPSSDPVREARVHPLTDDEAAAQVVASAEEVVAVAGLREATGAYTFVSCHNETDPPYQAAVYMNFHMPQNNWVKYLHDVASAMTSHGWTASPAMGEHFGHKLTKDGVTSIFHRNVNDADFATMRIYGECRNTADHRDDNPAWSEITFQLG